jgi:3-isopropylmalate dehydratase small subunit
MLPIVLPRKQVDDLMTDCDAGKLIDVDLASQTITREDGTKYTFEIDEFRKHCLLNGLDDIGLTLQKENKIASFERARAKTSPWFESATQKAPSFSVI